jgi:hypothetical protein
MRAGLITLPLLIGTVGGCSNKKSGGDVASGPVASVNALVPASLKDKLVFEERTIKDGPYRYVLPAPKAWGGVLTSIGPDDATLTSVMVVYKCAGEPCKAMDWNADIDAVYTEAPLQRDKVEKDQKGKNSREIVAEKDGMKLVLAARWADGADHYLWCEVHLDKGWSEALAAFEKACEVTKVTDSGGFGLL